VRILYICGHLDLTQEEFNEYYLPVINACVYTAWNFIVGDADGVDKFAQEFLDSKLLMQKKRVTVYHMSDKPRNNIGDFQVLGGFSSDEERDSAMLKRADKILAWIKPGREKSGTAKNLLEFYTMDKYDK
jgi:hypothetical protein